MNKTKDKPLDAFQKGKALMFSAAAAPRKALKSLRQFGFLATLLRVGSKLRGDGGMKYARQQVFTDADLTKQRAYTFPRSVRFSLVTPLYNTPERFLREMIESVLTQTYADWELCMADGSDAAHGEVERVCREYAERDSRVRYRRLEKNLGISGNSNACLEMAAGEYVGLLDHDDLLHPAALHEVMRAICELGADVVYTDESTFRNTPRDAYRPHFKPAYAPDNLRANNYICHFTVFKRALLDEVGVFDPQCDGSQDHDLILRLTERAGCVAHVPEILYYWRAHPGSVAQEVGLKPYVIAAGVRAVEKQLARLGLEGEVSPIRPGLTLYRVRYSIKGTPKVSILITDHGRLKDLRACLDAVWQKTTWPNYEIVVVESGGASPAPGAYCEKLQKEHKNVRFVTRPGVSGDSAAKNFGARFCTGDYLLLLSGDTKPITPDWIQEMLMFAQRPDVGAVGCKLCDPLNRIRHAGTVLGFGGIVGDAFRRVNQAHLGYMCRLLYAQDLTAVTADCMLLRRSVWDGLNGLDEGFSAALSGVDLCMRIRQAGLLVVWTPYASLCQRKRGGAKEKQERFSADGSRFQSRWQKELEAGDLYYNPNFIPEGEGFSVSRALRQHDAR